MRQLNEKIAVVNGANGNGQALAKRLPVDVAAVATADAGAIFCSATRGLFGPPRVTSFAGGVAEKLAHREAERAFQQSIASASTRRDHITG